MKLAFTDSGDGYYECDSPDGSIPDWAKGMTPCTVRVPVQTPAEIQSNLESAVQAYMDAQAQLKGYDNIVSACSYAAAPNAFQAEGISFLNWRAACWSYCYTLLAQVNAGTAAVPTAAQLIAGLPVRV